MHALSHSALCHYRSYCLLQGIRLHRANTGARTAENSDNPELQDLLVGQRLEPPHLPHTHTAPYAIFVISCN